MKAAQLKMILITATMLAGARKRGFTLVEPTALKKHANEQETIEWVDNYNDWANKALIAYNKTDEQYQKEIAAAKKAQEEVQEAVAKGQTADAALTGLIELLGQNWTAEQVEEFRAIQEEVNVQYKAFMESEKQEDKDVAEQKFKDGMAKFTALAVTAAPGK